MISREWVATWLATHLTRARVHTDMPVIPMAEQMTDEVIDKWLEGEAQFWKHASSKQGLTPGQVALRVQVSRFYEQRLTAHRRVSLTRDTDTEEES